MNTAECRGGWTGKAGWFVVCATVLSCAVTARAGAIVSCADPDNLCRGQLCVTPPMEVEKDCVVDFGDRVLVIGGTLKVPNGGRLVLKAGVIDVRRAIIGRHAKPFEGSGASIELVSKGSLTVGWRIDASGRTTPGSVTLIAGGNISLFAPVRAAANGPDPTAPGGKIRMQAGGVLQAVGRARIRAEGDIDTPGGEIQLTGARGVFLHNRIGADGASGGSVAIATRNGDVLVGDSLTATGDSGAGGTVSVTAVGGRLTAIDYVDTDGAADGGNIILVGGGDVITFGDLRARGPGGSGGTIVLASNANVLNYEALYAGGRRGGQISLLSSFGMVRTQAPLLAAGAGNDGGSIGIIGSDGVVIGSMVNADGQLLGGEINVFGFAVELGTRGDLFARGATGGTVSLRGATVSVEMGARVLVDGDAPGGSIRLAATEGDLTLSGSFRARGRNGGRIEADAAGNLRADGAFESGRGCIALSGASVDISGGTFDAPVVAECP